MKHSLLGGLLLLITATMACAQGAAEKATAAVAPDKVLPFKTVDSIQLSLHMFFPSGHQVTDRRPAIVFFFGGGWNGGTPRQFYKQSAHLASLGMVAICAEYRVKSRHGTAPSVCVQDGKSAIRWVRSHAAELGIDPNRIAAGGGSAGGHVAAATATAKGFNEAGEDVSVSCLPNALVLFNPVFDNGPEGYGHDRVKDYWQDFSPMHNIDETTPPTIVFLGSNDRLIPVATAEEYKKRMQAAGARCVLHVHDGEGHGFFNTRKYDETTEQMDAFLRSLKYLRDAPEAAR